jgi:glycerol-3-phosphate dehydrogenase (NAD(P)+)
VSSRIASGAAVSWICATKGLELGTLKRMSEVLGETLRDPDPVILTGPSHAEEVSRGIPTSVVAAARDETRARAVQRLCSTERFRVYTNDDVPGCEYGAALKNVIAIAAGVVESLRLGHNATAALITRGLAEISRLACAMGGRRETLSGLSGLGDLVLTCTGSLSRNRRVGVELGQGRALADVLAGTRMVAEGVRTTSAALALGARHGVELPIAAQMADVLAGRRSPKDALGELMLRPQRDEVDEVGV